MKRSAVLALLVLAVVVIWASVAYVQAREEIKLTTIIPDQTTALFKKGVIGATYLTTFASNPDLIPDSALFVEGKVGIGTTTPQAKLDVNGSIAVGGQQGTSGQVLTSQGAGSTPIWSAPAGTVNAVQVSSSTREGAPIAMTTMPGMTLTINTTAPNSRVLVTFSTSIVVGGNAGANFRLMIDGNNRHQIMAKGNGGGNSYPAVSLQYMETFATVGAHTILIQWQVSGSWAYTIGPGWTRVLNAVELK
ncbi:MAG: hypothetical protein Q8O01_06110 [Candidatus Omnitrophota bacterium]|nr:hypothetical protein [Candidatus Omnitrophota bacterium]